MPQVDSENHSIRILTPFYGPRRLGPGWGIHMKHYEANLNEMVLTSTRRQPTSTPCGQTLSRNFKGCQNSYEGDQHKVVQKVSEFVWIEFDYLLGALTVTYPGTTSHVGRPAQSHMHGGDQHNAGLSSLHFVLSSLHGIHKGLSATRRD